MMSKIVSSFIVAIVIFSIILLSYGLFLIKKFKNDKLAEVPFPFNSMYSALSEIVIVRSYLDYLQRSFYLIHVNRVKSEVLASLCVLLMPSMFIILFTFVNLFSPVWYLSALVFIVCALIPFYILRSYVVKKCIVSRISLLKSFTSLTSLLSNGTISSASEDMVFSTYGNIREIYKEFLRIYRFDKKGAYGFLTYITGDNYTRGVTDSLRAFDEEGSDPTDEVNKICKQGLDIFSLQLMGFRKFADLKLSSVIMFGFTIGIRFFGEFLGNAMNFQYNEIIGYFCMILVLVSLTLCYAFESNV